jgi:hypothetical protein
MKTEVQAIADAQEAERFARDPRVVAIRKDPQVGCGSCSVIDECWTDRELVEHLDHEKINGPRSAVLAAHDLHDIYSDNADEIESTAF